MLIQDDFLSDKQRKNLAILDIIRKQGPITKPEISQATDINIVTVSHYVDHYIKQGIVLELGLDDSSGGRRPLLVKLNPKAGFIIGVGLNMMDIVAVALDLESNLICEIKQARPAKTTTTTSPISIEDGEAIVYSLVEVVDELIQELKADVKQVKGIGVGIPGIIDAPGKRIKWPNKIGASDIVISISVKDLFENKFGISTLVENDANLAAFGEKWLAL